MKFPVRVALISMILLFSINAWCAKVCETLLANEMKLTVFWNAVELGKEPSNLAEFRKKLDARTTFFKKNDLYRSPRIVEFTGDIEATLREYSRQVLLFNMTPANFFFEDWQQQEKDRIWLGSWELIALLEQQDKLTAYLEVDASLAGDLEVYSQRVLERRAVGIVPFPGNAVMLKAVESVFIEVVELATGGVGKISPSCSQLPSVCWTLQRAAMTAPKNRDRDGLKALLRRSADLFSSLQAWRRPFESVDEDLSSAVWQISRPKFRED